MLLIPAATPPSGPPITPNDRFFNVSIDGTPNVNISAYYLTVFGLVDHKLNLSYGDVLAMNSSAEKETVRCVSGPSGTAVWVGVRLEAVLDMAGIASGAQKVVFYCLDGYSTSITVADANRTDVLIAYEMNNATMPADQGYPLKIVVPGEWGYKWAKWVYAIEIVGYDYKGYWESRGWADDATISPISDWFPHAVLMSVAFAIGVFSAISGLRNSVDKSTADLVPDLFDRRYHRYVSIIFYVLFILTFIYWVSVTQDLRGAVFFTLHGRLALLTMVFAIVGIVTGIGMARNTKRYRFAHWVSNLTCLSLMAVTIVLGVLLAIG